MPWAGMFDSRAGNISEKPTQGAGDLKLLMLSPSCSDTERTKEQNAIPGTLHKGQDAVLSYLPSGVGTGEKMISGLVPCLLPTYIVLHDVPYHCYTYLLT